MTNFTTNINENVNIGFHSSKKIKCRRKWSWREKTEGWNCGSPHRMFFLTLSTALLLYIYLSVSGWKSFITFFVILYLLNNLSGQIREFGLGVSLYPLQPPQKNPFVKKKRLKEIERRGRESFSPLFFSSEKDQISNGKRN